MCSAAKLLQNLFLTDHVLILPVIEDDMHSGEESSSNIDFLLFDFQTQPSLGGEVSHPDPSCASKLRGVDPAAVAQKLSLISEFDV